MIGYLNSLARRIPVWLVYLLGFIPVAVAVNGVFNNSLGPDPLAALEHQSGIWALRFLIAALVVTPLLKSSIQPQISRFPNL